MASRRWIHLLLLGCGIPAAACTANVEPSRSPLAPIVVAQPTATPAPTFAASIETAGPALIAAERAASISRDRTTLRSLWTDDARIVDGRGTPTTDDDYIWQGLPALFDRYELAVFPSPPPPLDDPALPTAIITLTGDTATLDNAGDRWHLVRHDGRWWLAALIYSAPD